MTAKVFYAFALGVLLVLGCGEGPEDPMEVCRRHCEAQRCSEYYEPDIDETIALKCSCVPKFCCDTCEGEQLCLDQCVERDD